MIIRTCSALAVGFFLLGCEREPAPPREEPTRYDQPTTPQEWPTGLTPGGPRVSPLVPAEPPERQVPPAPALEPTPREMPRVPATQVE